jgi:hypothetical protein
MSVPFNRGRTFVAAASVLTLAFASHAHGVAAVVPQIDRAAPGFDGRSLAGWAVVGSGQWIVEDGALIGQGARGAGVLKSTRTWANFVLRAELLAEDGAETSVGVRCPDRDHAPATARSCYRVSLNDRDR